MDGEEPSGILPLSSNEQLLTYDIHNIHIVRVLLYIMGHLNNERDRSDDGESRTGGGCNRKGEEPATPRPQTDNRQGPEDEDGRVFAAKR